MAKRGLLAFGVLFLFTNLSFAKFQITKQSPRQTSPHAVESRTRKMVELYNYSAILYSQNGPSAFWKSFAYLATEPELQSLIKSTKGYPSLPTVKLKTPRTLEVFHSEKTIAEITILNFDRQILSINKRILTIPKGASINETATLLELELYAKNQSNGFWKGMLEGIFFRTANAMSNATRNTGNGGFFSKLFGSFSHGLWGQKSNNLGSGGTGLGTGTAAHSTVSISSNANVAPLENIAPAPIPATPSPTPSPSASNSASNVKYYKTEGNPSSSLLETLKIPQLELGQTSCTVIFTRHGEKDSGDQLLTTDGWNQAHALSLSMQDFESRYGNFDYVLHSNEKRSIQTASPFVNHIQANNRSETKIAPDDMQKLLRECHPYSETKCSDQAAEAFNGLKNYCDEKKGAKIFITSHGSLGRHLMQKMAGGSLPGGPDCARPYVFTLESGTSFKKVHQSTGDRLCTN